ncbi:MAG: amidohydrolase [Deltaproteobacteria bacterium]|nr:MAG: amidohydrolase [Deltaproteobacteria bacterium]
MLLAIALAAGVVAPTDAYLDQTRTKWEQFSKQIWSYAETGLREDKSAQAFEEALQKEGFTVTKGVGGMPTAFVATAGKGEPVVAILAEYDALPGLSQKPGEAKKDPEQEGGPGHGCGHNLLGTAALAAGIAANHARIEEKLPGTIQVFGTPAEELLLGKVFMLKAGSFDHTDIVLTWHPEASNQVVTRPRLALTATDVEFFGKTAHAAAAPWLGRSSLDAVELFDHAMSLMREHIQPTARIHRTIKNGGLVPNVIPDYAKIQVWLRDQTGAAVQEMLERMRKAAEGAALGTETRAKVTVLASGRDPINNEVIGRTMQKHLDEFAKAVQKEVGAEPSGLSTEIVPFGPNHGGTASSDLGEVSAAKPLAELNVVTRPMGTAAHTWGQTACAIHPLGLKGMDVASKVLGATAVDFLQNPKLVSDAKAEFARATKGKPYQSPLAMDAKPAVY